MFKRIVIGVATFSTVLVGAAMCSAIVNPSHKTTAPPIVGTAVPVTPPGIAPAGAPSIPAVTSSAAPTAVSGKWLVPGEIKPGTYRMNLRDGATLGYWALCADLACNIGAGMLNSGLVNGPDVLVIPDTAVAVKLDRVVLTAMPS